MQTDYEFYDKKKSNFHKSYYIFAFGLKKNKRFLFFFKGKYGRPPLIIGTKYEHSKFVLEKYLFFFEKV
jgi:hypothetical protein